MGANQSDPSLLLWQRFSVSYIQPALHKDTLLKTHPVVADVEDPADITSRFDDISYLKGGSILRMLYEALTPEVFKAGVSQYLMQHKYNNTETKGRWAEEFNSIYY